MKEVDLKSPAMVVVRSAKLRRKDESLSSLRLTTIIDASWFVESQRFNVSQNVGEQYDVDWCDCTLLL